MIFEEIKFTIHTEDMGRWKQNWLEIRARSLGREEFTVREAIPEDHFTSIFDLVFKRAHLRMKQLIEEKIK